MYMCLSGKQFSYLLRDQDLLLTPLFVYGKQSVYQAGS